MNDDWKKGKSLFDARSYEEAIPHLQRAARASEDIEGASIRGAALSHLGTAQYALGLYEDAVESFQTAIRHAPRKPRLHYNAGNSLLALGRLREARQQYEAALELDSGYTEARQALQVVLDDLAQQEQGAVEPSTNPEPAAPAPRPKRERPASGNITSRARRIEELEAQLQAALQSIKETRFLLERQEQHFTDLAEELAATLREHSVQSGRSGR